VSIQSSIGFSRLRFRGSSIELIGVDQFRNRRKERQGPSEANKQEDRDRRKEIIRVGGIVDGAERTIAAARIDLEGLHDRKNGWNDRFGLDDNTSHSTSDVSKADKQKDRDTRREISRVEAIVTGAEKVITDASIDLEDLNDQKKEWDDKFGLGEDTAHSSTSVRPDPIATIIAPSFPRPTIPIVDDGSDEVAEEDVQDFQGNTEEQERRRLARMFVRPGAKSVVAHNLPFLRLVREIDSNIQRFRDDNGQARRLVRQFPLPPSTGDQAPPMQEDLCQIGRDTWQKLDEILSKEGGERAERYEECFSKWGSNRGRALTPEIEARKRAEWGWWWARLLAESKGDTLDVGLWTRLIAIEKTKANQLPQPPRKGKR